MPYRIGPSETVAEKAKNRIRALIVDDSTLLLETFEMILGRDRFEPASSVEEAFDKLSHDEGLRIIVTDLSMPRGGAPFLAALRDRFPGRAVIVLSGDLSGFDDEEARALGVVRMLDKAETRAADIEDAIREAEARIVAPGWPAPA